jgi:hypothetical protein
MLQSCVQIVRLTSPEPHDGVSQLFSALSRCHSSKLGKFSYQASPYLIVRSVAGEEGDLRFEALISSMKPLTDACTISSCAALRRLRSTSQYFIIILAFPA